MTKITMYGSPYCPPCRIHKPKVQKFCEVHDIEFEYINTIENEDKASKLGIRKIPVLYVGEERLMDSPFDYEKLKNKVDEERS